MDLYWAPGEPLEGPERWYPIEGYEGIYEISTLGRVRRIAGGHGVKHPIPRLLKLPPNQDGYLTVRLSRDGDAKTWNVHTLVTLTFHGRPPPEIAGDAEADHINGDRADPAATNMRWLSKAANIERITRKEHDEQGADVDAMIERDSAGVA